jgi:chromosome segregation ATPase
MKPLVARMLARRDAARAELSVLETERAKLQAEAEAMRAADRGELAEALGSALTELDAQLAQQREAAAQAEVAFREAAADMAQLEHDEDNAERATLRGIVDSASGLAGDPLSASPEDAALARVREHARELEARVGLDRELSGARTTGRTLDGVGAAATGTGAPPAAPLDPEAQARAQLAALKEARKKRSL